MFCLHFHLNVGCQKLRLTFVPDAVDCGLHTGDLYLKEHQYIPSFRWCDCVYSELFVTVAFSLRPSLCIFHHLMSAVISLKLTKPPFFEQLVVFNTVSLMIVVVLLPVVSVKLFS